MRILLILMFLFTITVQGQLNLEQFDRNYTVALPISQDGKDLGWRDVDIWVIFNFEMNKILIFYKDKVIKLVQKYPTERKITENYLWYQELIMEYELTKEEIKIQFFEDADYGFRIFFKNKSMIQFTN